MDEWTPHDEQLDAFAAALDVDPATVLRALGGGWQRCGVDSGSWPVDGWAHATWFATGDPLQVLAGVDFRSLVLARPVIRWRGGVCVITAAEVREFAREDVVFQPELLADVVEELARRSRRRFRWCRTCRAPSAPEHMLDRDECMGCGARYRGLVH